MQWVNGDRVNHQRTGVRNMASVVKKRRKRMAKKKHKAPKEGSYSASKQEVIESNDDASK